MKMKQEYSVGQLVCLRADPTRKGPIIEILPEVGGMQRYRVFHSPDDIREYRADQLIPGVVVGLPDELEQAILDNSWVSEQTFHARLTASRLAHPQIDNIYALHSARIQFIPFQFKPLLRVLRADQPRLLIADEVGVGKTIEAGLILKELQTRQRLDNVLVICPKALVTKWREEMRRFDEEFRPLTSELYQYCLKETHLDGFWPIQYSRAIIHFELLRIDKYLSGKEGKRSLPGLLTLDPPPRFSLVIIDEAHHVRNPETNSHELARFFCDVSEAVLFLSATPVHIGSQNLFSLLNLLRPDLFPDMNVFRDTIEPNKYIFEAMRTIRSKQPGDIWQNEAAKSLTNAARTSWGRSVLTLDPRFTNWKNRLQANDVDIDRDRVRCLRDLEEVHTLAHIMNRTRRRDIGRFTIREPHTVSVAFTEEQQEFYNELIDFRKSMLLTQYDPVVVRLILDTIERQAASCLTALVPALESFLNTGNFSGRTITDDPEGEDVEEVIPEHLIDQAMSLRELALALPPDDPKFDHLYSIINEAINREGPGKVLVFSYFLHTLYYLQEKLEDFDIRVGLITGRVKDEEREELRGRFRLPREDQNALDVLLSSEVGCEGLDYEFCDQLVNYDIPWNPMRIEQRIGRIDRFGQVSDKVLIFNFITPGTVEERIFYRCFERLGIFKDAVGDLEEVLGDLIQNLTQLALNPALTPQQAEEKAQQMADNAIRKIDEEHRLEEESGALMGLDESFIQDVDDLVREKRFVSPHDLRTMISVFVEEPNLGGRIPKDEKVSGLYRLRLRKDSRLKLLDQINPSSRSDRPTIAFSRWLQGSDPYYLMTFDQKIALERREIPFVTPVHPLARLAIDYWMGKDEPLVANLMVLNDQIKSGIYIFVCELWESIGLKSEIRLVGYCWDYINDQPSHELSDILLSVLIDAKERKIEPEIEEDQIGRIFGNLEEEIENWRQKILIELQERNEILIARRKASLEVYYQNRRQRVLTELNRTKDERIIRMKESERDRIIRDYENNLQSIVEKSDTDIITRRVAAGILEVENA